MTTPALSPSPVKDLEFWRTIQKTLPEVLRWSKYVRRNPVLRHQTTDVHSLSLGVLMSYVLPLLYKVDNTLLDAPLLLTSVICHDIGEGAVKTGHRQTIVSDVHFIDKTTARDIEEYLAFREIFEGSPSWPFFQKAFLLQFCLGKIEEFPEDAQPVMRELFATHYTEAAVFCGVEAFDYILYALECYEEHGDEVILTHVLRNQPDRMDDFVAKAPCLEAIWTPELRKWCALFVASHTHIPAEKDTVFSPP